MTQDRAFLQPLLSYAEPAPAAVPAAPKRAAQPADNHVAIALARQCRDNGDLQGARRVLEDVDARAAAEPQAAAHAPASRPRLVGSGHAAESVGSAGAAHRECRASPGDRLEARDAAPPQRTPGRGARGAASRAARQLADAGMVE